jgi:hypothetical protein
MKHSPVVCDVPAGSSCHRDYRDVFAGNRITFELNEIFFAVTGPAKKRLEGKVPGKKENGDHSLPPGTVSARSGQS